MTLAERLADYAGTVSFHRLPSEVVHEVKRRLLDSVGCALGAAKLLRLSQMATTQAVNLAGVANVALRQTRVGEVSMWKACAFSNAARNGVFAALLAGEGMTGPAPIFEGEKGFMKLVSGSLELPSLGGESVRAQVPFKIMDTYIKHYPVEYHAQTAVEAALPLREQLLRAEGREFVQAIQEIEVGSYDVAIEIIGRDPEKWRPQTRETADHSFPYCVAMALVYGVVTSQSFNARRLNDPVVGALMRKLRVVEVDEFRGRYPHTMPTRLMVRMAGGRQYTVEIDVPLGHPRRPMPDVDIVHKVRRLSAGRLKESRLERFVEAVWKLETVKDVGTLMAWLKL